MRAGTFLGLVELEFLLVVPSQRRFILSVRLHAELSPEALHVVCRNTREAGFNTPDNRSAVLVAEEKLYKLTQRSTVYIIMLH